MCAKGVRDEGRGAPRPAKTSGAKPAWWNESEWERARVCVGWEGLTVKHVHAVLHSLHYLAIALAPILFVDGVEGVIG